jgi:hypothetical protein
VARRVDLLKTTSQTLNADVCITLTNGQLRLQTSCNRIGGARFAFTLPTNVTD